MLNLILSIALLIFTIVIIAMRVRDLVNQEYCSAYQELQVAIPGGVAIVAEILLIAYFIRFVI